MAEQVIGLTRNSCREDIPHPLPGGRLIHPRQGVGCGERGGIESIEGAGHGGRTRRTRGEGRDIRGNRVQQVRPQREKPSEVVFGTTSQVIGEAARRHP